MVIKLNLLKEIKSLEVLYLINKLLKISKIELSNKSFSISEKITLRSHWIDSEVSIDVKEYFLNEEF